MPEFQFPKGIRVRRNGNPKEITVPDYRAHFGEAIQPPAYPVEALSQGIEGSVVVDYVVGNDGVMKEVKLRSGDALLAVHALETVRQWNFRPLTVNGRPVEVHTEVDVIYTRSDGTVRIE